MTTVFCSICQEEKESNDCWCVIDAKTKERYYECKKKCKTSIPIEITIPSNTIVEEEKQTTIPLEPPKGLLERAMEWFVGKSDGYKRMKVE